MTASDYLRRKPDLSKWWAEITSDPRFDEIILIAGADIVALMHADKIEGARVILESLRNMVYKEPEPREYPTPGTIHDPLKA